MENYISTKLYNTLTKRLEPLLFSKEEKIGLYVCGPTVYSDPHIGHARSAVVFDLLVRYLRYLNYKVCYVRNITDVGHLTANQNENEEDKIIRSAKKEQILPMEVVQKYTLRYHDALEKLAVIPADIEPRASAHIPEQIAWIEKLIKKNYAYVVNGSVYFRSQKYRQKYANVTFFKQKIEKLTESEEKKIKNREKESPLDFALWKLAPPQHLMRWDSPWGVGFPGWHTECAVMASHYLGIPFYFHGGGHDLCFPHHECEIAQMHSHSNIAPVKHWIHHGLVLVNGVKISKSLANAVSLHNIFRGNHSTLRQAYNPMVVRYLILQSHYRKGMQFSNQALQIAKKGYEKLVNGWFYLLQNKPTGIINNTVPSTAIDRLLQITNSFSTILNSDLHTPKLFVAMFNLISNMRKMEKKNISIINLPVQIWEKIANNYIRFFQDILGFRIPKTPKMLNIALSWYQQAKKNKENSTIDRIRSLLQKENIHIEDRIKSDHSWRYSIT